MSKPYETVVTNRDAQAVPVRLVAGGGAALVPTTARVNSATSSTPLLAANAARKGLCVSNISTAKLYLSFSGTATVNNSFVELPAGGFLLLDSQLIVPNAVTCIWDAANGGAQVTEFV